MNVKESLVLYPCLGMGHLNPFVELAKVFTGHGFAVTIAVIDTTFSISSDMDTFISRISSSYPSISFLRLPKVTPPPTKDMSLTLAKSASLSNRYLLEFLQSSDSPSNIRALVLDFFCSSALDVADQLHIPSYFFCSVNASGFACFSFMPTLQSQLPGSARDLGNTPLHIPGLPPIPASHLPTPVLDRGEGNDLILSHFQLMPSASGIMINTFESLEKRALQAIVNGDCVPGKAMPPIYCIGPLMIPAGSEGKGGGERHECLEWLDAQPEKSVVFLCFGSFGSFSAEQLKETATGLERSGQRFLWVVRSPPSDPDAALESLLPKGFLERTKGQGMVMKSWAPQAAVLGHKSVGGFVSHCGWNSTLEAVSSGVPMIGWPLYAEQRMNKIVMVEEMKIGVGIEGYDKGLVSAEEVEAKIRWLMESEDGKALRDRVTEMKEEAVAARKEGGSSTLAWLELVRALRKDTLDTEASSKN